MAAFDNYPEDTTASTFLTFTNATATTGTIYFPLTGYADNTWPILPTLTAEELRQRQLLLWTQEAIQEACEKLRVSPVDPSGVLHYRPRREPSKRLHDQPKFRRRICAGSSRYRVMR